MQTIPVPDAAPTALSASKPQTLYETALADANDFIAKLAAMRAEVPGQPNRRGQLAQLKRNAGEKWPGRGVVWFSGLLYEGNAGWRVRHTDIYFLVATLYDLNREKPKPGELGFGDLGASLRQAVNSGANEDGVRRRFQILLDSNWDEAGDGELAFRLRQTAQWLAGSRVGLDWARLIADLCFWNSERRFVQKNWARSFFEAPRRLSNNAE